MANSCCAHYFVALQFHMHPSTAPTHACPHPPTRSLRPVHSRVHCAPSPPPKPAIVQRRRVYLPRCYDVSPPRVDMHFSSPSLHRSPPHASSATQQPSLSPRFRHHPPAHLRHPLPRLPPLVYATLPPIFPHTFIHYSPQHILLSRQASKLSTHGQHGHPVDCS